MSKRKGWRLWQNLAAAGPTGIAVMFFLAIHWPVDLLVVGVWIVYIGALAAVWRPVPYREILTLVAFVAVALFAISVGLLAAMLPGALWPPPAVLVALTVLAAGLGVLALLAPRYWGRADPG